MNGGKNSQRSLLLVGDWHGLETRLQRARLTLSPMRMVSHLCGALSKNRPHRLPAVPIGRRSSARHKPQATIFGKPTEGQNATQTHTTGFVPTYEPVRADAVGEGMMAGWQKNHPKHPNGLVLINIEHPVLRSVIEYWQSQHADHYSELIEKDVIAVYGQIAVSKVAHSEHLRRIAADEDD